MHGYPPFCIQDVRVICMIIQTQHPLECCAAAWQLSLAMTVSANSSVVCSKTLQSQIFTSGLPGVGLDSAAEAPQCPGPGLSNQLWHPPASAAALH